MSGSDDYYKPNWDGEENRESDDSRLSHQSGAGSHVYNSGSAGCSAQKKIVWEKLGNLEKDEEKRHMLTQLANLERELSDTKSKNRSLIEKQKNFTSELQTLQEQNRGFEEEVKREKEKGARIQSELKSYRSKFEDASEAVRRLKDEIEEKSKKIGDLEDLKIQHEAKLYNYDEKLGNLNTKVTTLESEMKKKEREISQLKDERDKILAEKDAIYLQISKKESELRQLRKEVAEFSKDKTVLSKEVSHLKSQKASADSTAAALEQELKLEKEKSSKIKIESENSKKELQKVRSDMTTTEAWNKMHGKEVQDLKEKIASMQKSFDSKERKMEKVHRKEINELKKEHKGDLKEQLDARAEMEERMKADMFMFFQQLHEKHQIERETMKAALARTTTELLNSAYQTYQKEETQGSSGPFIQEVDSDDDTKET